ncbi:hypothetical protein GWN42_19295 [candidate division KSB1 bacterium]|nr:hypothetical protein [candidate division KSB1 bacterium]
MSFVLRNQGPEDFCRCIDSNSVAKLRFGTSIFSKEFDDNYWIVKLRNVAIKNAIGDMSTTYHVRLDWLNSTTIHNSILVQYLNRIKKYNDRKIAISNMPPLLPEIARAMPTHNLPAMKGNRDDIQQAFAWVARISSQSTDAQN